MAEMRTSTDWDRSQFFGVSMPKVKLDFVALSMLLFFHRRKWI